MSRLDLSLFICRSAVIAAAALLTPACVAEIPEDLDEEAIGAAEQAAGTPQCVAYRRGVSGTVADATIWQDTPTYNMGASPLVYTGTSSAGFRQALLYFEVNNIPAGAHIDSAVIYLSELYKETGTSVDIHEILAPWSEDTVTWSNFNQAFDPAPTTSFFAWGGGTHQIHVEELVQRWVDGQTVNRGLLLQEHQQMASSFRSSDHGTVEYRPRLKVCYTPQ